MAANSAPILLRREVNDLVQDKDVCDLFVQAFQTINARGPIDPTSFEAIGGIHGYPYVQFPPKGEEQSPAPTKGQWLGYCFHGSMLFPTWHRPYVHLLERTIHEEIKKILGPDRINNPDDQIAQRALECGFPYWDWAKFVPEDPDKLTIPDLLTKPEYTFQSGQTIPNPLYSYTMKNEYDKNFAEYRQQLKYGNTTFRGPDWEDWTHGQRLRDTLNLVFQNKADDWEWFSNHAGNRKQENKFPGIESPHDSVHNYVGGNGWMADANIAGLDPIFFLHHCNVDRLLALWQYGRTGNIQDGGRTLVTPTPNEPVFQEADQGNFTTSSDATVGPESALTPFGDLDNKIFDSVSCWNEKALGYTYPEVAQYQLGGMSTEQMTEVMKRFWEMYPYSPATQNLKHRVLVHVPSVFKNAFNGSFEIRTLLTRKGTNEEKLAGVMHVFARRDARSCEQCQRVLHIRGTMDVSDALVKLFGFDQVQGFDGDASKLDELVRVRLEIVRSDGTEITEEEIKRPEMPQAPRNELHFGFKLTAPKPPLLDSRQKIVPRGAHFVLVPARGEE